MNSEKSTPRLFPPTPGWSPDGHRIQALLEYSRGLDKVWIYGALQGNNGKTLTLTAPARNTVDYLTLLNAIERAYPTGELYLVTDNLASHKSGP